MFKFFRTGVRHVFIIHSAFFPLKHNNVKVLHVIYLMIEVTINEVYKV